MAKLDLLDRKILSILDSNSRIPLSLMSKTLRSNRDKVKYRIKRLEQEGIIKKYVAQIDAAKLGYNVFKVFYKFQNIDVEKKKELIAWLKRNNFIYWIAESRGKWDLNMTLFANDVHHFDRIVAPFTELFGKYIAEQEINSTLEVGAFEKNWELGTERKEPKLLFNTTPKDLVLDEKDILLLKAIANNARENIISLAKKAKTTPRIAAYRLKDLQKRKIIMGYSISVDYDRLDKQFFKALIYFNILNEETKRKIREYCRTRKSVIYHIFCVGSWPLELEFAVKNNKEFYDEMESFREFFPEMKNYETIIFPEEYKFNWMPECYEAEQKTKEK